MALACMFAEMQATEQRCDASGSVQMQACDHEGVPSGEGDPHGDRMRPLYCVWWMLGFKGNEW